MLIETCRNVMRDNILINISGRDGHAVGVDKNCEQNINFQKVFVLQHRHYSWLLIVLHSELVFSERCTWHLGSTC